MLTIWMLTWFAGQNSIRSPVAIVIHVVPLASGAIGKRIELEIDKGCFGDIRVVPDTAKTAVIADGLPFSGFAQGSATVDKSSLTPNVESIWP
jgi:hypothetical protein